MADEEELEKDEKKKGGLLLYALIGVSAMLLLVVGLGVGYFIFSAPTNTPEEVEKVISEVLADNKKIGVGGAEGAVEDCVENEEGK
ncbi:MAG: hypothetical protein VW557_05785 [Rhodospirillaceae bacterium]